MLAFLYLFLTLGGLDLAESVTLNILTPLFPIPLVLLRLVRLFVLWRGETDRELYFGVILNSLILLFLASLNFF